MTTSDTLTIAIPITNIGKREGAEVVQLYIADKKSSLPRPIKELKGFQKVQLAPGETQYVSFIVDQNSLSYFNDTLHKWIAEAGEFEAIIGSSSEEIKARINFELK